MTEDQTDLAPVIPSTLPTTPSPTHPLQPTSIASGWRPSRGDGLALGGSSLRMTPTHTVQSNPPFLCVLLSLGILGVPIVYGFHAPGAFFALITDRRVHENATVGGRGRKCERTGMSKADAGHSTSQLCGKPDVVVGVAQKRTMRQGFEVKRCM